MRKNYSKITNDMSTLINSLKSRCAAAGTNITAVCKQAGVSRSTIERWKAKPPKSLQILDALEEQIQEAENSTKVL